jgi:tetratricopeptide (TPR) repeat protein
MRWSIGMAVLFAAGCVLADARAGDDCVAAQGEARAAWVKVVAEIEPEIEAIRAEAARSIGLLGDSAFIGQAGTVEIRRQLVLAFRSRETQYSRIRDLSQEASEAAVGDHVGALQAAMTVWEAYPGGGLTGMAFEASEAAWGACAFSNEPRPSLRAVRVPAEKKVDEVRTGEAAASEAAAAPERDEACERGRSLQRQARSEEALEAYKQALVLDPHHVPTRYEIGRTYRALDLWEDAAASWECVLELDPGHDDAVQPLQDARSVAAEAVDLGVAYPPQTTEVEFAEAEDGPDGPGGFPVAWRFELDQRQYQVGGSNSDRSLSVTDIGAESPDTDILIEVPEGFRLGEGVEFAEYDGDLLLLTHETNSTHGAALLVRTGQDGTARWRRLLPGFNPGPPIVVCGVAYVSAIGGVGKIDLETGEFLWMLETPYERYKITAYLPAEVRTDRVVFVESSPYRGPRKVLVVDRETGVLVREETL